jgi:hypothetical protein
MSQTPLYTDADRRLTTCLANRVSLFREKISQGRPYVWELRLGLSDFYALESALNQSIASHGGMHQHLMTEELAPVTVIYVAEWYKRYYRGADTMDDNRVLALTTDELKQLYRLAHIDTNTFVYNASKNPDKTSMRWLESLQVLGGLAVQAELKRDESDPLLPQLCRIFHGEDISLDDLKDRNRAVAFQESISRQHSLYDYLDCILDPTKEPPFAPEDLRNEDTMIPQLLHRIAHADRLAKRDKFDFEWVVAYTASRQQMVRHLRVRLKPEVIGGGRKQYIGYDRLRQPEWAMEHPEAVGRIRFHLRFKNGAHYVKKEQKGDEPLFKYDNTGSEKTGFLSVNTIDENTCTQVPVQRFDRVEMVMRYDETFADGTTREHCHIVQELPVNDYMQLYALPKTSNKFSTRRNSQTATVVVFSSVWHLAPDYSDLPVTYAHYRCGEEESEDYCWCPINDKVVLADRNGKELMPPFFNRNGLYQVVMKKYLKTIKYRDNVFVLYRYIDPEYDEDELQDDIIPVLFGRSGLQVLHYAKREAEEGEPVTDYDLEWLKSGKYEDWQKEEPQQGAIRLRVTVKGIVFKMMVYYVPFTPTAQAEAPIWRDFDHQQIRTVLEGVDDIQDDFRRQTDYPEADTCTLEIGTPEEKILVDVYRPIIVRELSQLWASDGKTHILGYSGKGEKIQLPLICCDQFSVRDFSESGVREYHIKAAGNLWYGFTTINQTGLALSNYLESNPITKLTDNIPVSDIEIYLTKAIDHAPGLYGWNYREAPRPLGEVSEMEGEGIVFQSLKDNPSPRHYACPVFHKNEADDWGDDDDDWGDNEEDETTSQAGSGNMVSPLDCFLTAAEHHTYFFLFDPLVKTIAIRSQINDILLPLLQQRNYELTAEDTANLYTLALHFHFDWMLLPRTMWLRDIEASAKDEAEQEQMKTAVEAFFCATPKCTDERERRCLQEMTRQYWTFTAWPKVDEVADRALRLIQDQPDALGKIGSLKDFLKQYDDCRCKFSEMSKVITNVEQ